MTNRKRTHSNQIDPEHFFEKMTYQELFSDLVDNLEVDICEINLEQNGRTTAKSSIVESEFSSFNTKFSEEPTNENNLNNLNYVSNLLNDEEKRGEGRKKKKKLILKPLVEKFLGRVEEKN